MEPTIIHKKSFILLGCVFYGDPFHSAEEWTYENEIGKLWNRFLRLVYKYKSLLERICTNSEIGFELHLEPEEYKESRNYYVMVGVEVNYVKEIPLEMFIKILPETEYVLFTTKVGEKINESTYIFKNWIPKHGYEQAFPFIMESYDGNRYKGLDDPKSEIDWYIPIKKMNSNRSDD